MSTEAILVLNCGSSSVKADVYDVAVKVNPLSFVVERVGAEGTRMRVQDNGAEHAADLPRGTHADAVRAILDAMRARALTPRAVGHRVVHGGEKLTHSARIDDAVLQEIRNCVPLAPLHNPANIAGIEAVNALRVDADAIPQVAVFDTAFHHTLPPEAHLYAIPRRFHVDDGMRRYGFHGTSHRYVALRAAEFFARPVETLRLVTLHLGNGCSACAVDQGRSVDTTMGMTPLEGLMMGTRSGDVDPAVVLRLARALGIDEAERVLNKESGLLGVSMLSQDMRDLEAAADAGNADALLAIRMFSRRVRKAVGALACAMGGLDGIVFTGGIGENSARVRADICDGLRVVGALLHDRKNAARSSAERDLSTMDSRARILVIPTDEERAIALQTREVLGLDGTSPSTSTSTSTSTS